MTPTMAILGIIMAGIVGLQIMYMMTIITRNSVILNSLMHGVYSTIKDPADRMQFLDHMMMTTMARAEQGEIDRGEMDKIMRHFKEEFQEASENWKIIEEGENLDLL